jgi:glycerate kinase
LSPCKTNDRRLHNVKNIYIGLGGSSTNDAGTAALTALGIKFLNSQHNSLPLGGIHLNELEYIDISNLNPLIKSKKIILLNDVRNVLCGKDGASFVFAPQKGATSEETILLDKGLNKFQEILKKDLSIDVSNLNGGGAAGGIGAGFFALLNAELKNGIETILDLINFDSVISNADLIITGEGKIDNQTKYGKVISGITSKAKGIPVIAFCALLDGDKEKTKKELGLKNIFPVVNENISIDMSLEKAEKYLKDTVEKNLENIFPVIL